MVPVPVLGQVLPVYEPMGEERCAELGYRWIVKIRRRPPQEARAMM